jgi:prephenate dehydrogenase
MPKKVYGIHGLGIMGGSIALAIKTYLPDSKVIGFGRGKEKLMSAKRLGIIDEVSDNSPEMLASLDYFIIATPAQNVADVFAEYHNFLSDDVIIMDVASVKRIVIKEVNKINHRGLNFVGTHPMAGSEKSGMEFARADLFEKKIVAVIGEGREDILAAVRDFWKAMGAQIVLVSADFHDEIVASTSHSPHLISSALSRLLEKDGWSEVRFFGLYGKGILDTTRIAQGNPEMWADIILVNADNVERSLIDFSREIQSVIEMIRKNKREELIEYLRQAKEFRESL